MTTNATRGAVAAQPLRERLIATLSRPPMAAVPLAIAVLLVAIPWIVAIRVNLPYVQWLVGIDSDIYFNATRTWLADGQWWLPHQVAGPYPITYGDVLYPPILLYLTVPFQVLPYAAWWLIPFAITAWALWRIRPPSWCWPLLVMCLAWPLTMEEIIKGNPVIWVMALMSVSVALRLPTTLVLLKPSLFPFALIGAHRRAWWLLLAGMGVASLPFLQLTLQYPQVVLNSQGGGLLYSVRDIPLLLMPVIAAVAAGTLRLGRPALRGRAGPATQPG